MNHLEERGELLRIDRPVDVVYEAGAIADLLVKNDGPSARQGGLTVGFPLR